ncbi:MAG: N-acetylmuramoyl-L-alanine amidase [Eubacterium sp.]|nr:N-acetylmuramoyl-L-alanine amidase [Eubacterium sp.]
MNVKKKVSITTAAALLFFITLLAAAVSRHLLIRDIFQPLRQFCVVLDAGHGGDDPGKVSASGVLEKDINLAITLKCKSVLEQNGIRVILTRDRDQSIEDPDADGKKAGDLKKRRQIIRDQKPDCAVSIHQNSYPDASQAGSQVFYQAANPQARELASLIQKQIRTVTFKENRREIKANSDYYLLRDNPVPTVITEVCFLSNPREAEMITEEYVQDKAAFGIAMGIMQYLYACCP